MVAKLAHAEVPQRADILYRAACASRAVHLAVFRRYVGALLELLSADFPDCRPWPVEARTRRADVILLVPRSICSGVWRRTLG